MSTSIDREFLTKVQKRATEECVTIALGVVDQMLLDNDLAYGDLDLKNPAEFVSFYTDLAERGVLTSLVVRAPKFADQLRRRYERDFAKVALEV